MCDYLSIAVRCRVREPSGWTPFATARKGSFRAVGLEQVPGGGDLPGRGLSGGPMSSGGGLLGPVLERGVHRLEGGLGVAIQRAGHQRHQDSGEAFVLDRRTPPSMRAVMVKECSASKTPGMPNRPSQRRR
jgi:hypothetical protein